jgi:hypothetical protein
MTNEITNKYRKIISEKRVVIYIKLPPFSHPRVLYRIHNHPVVPNRNQLNPVNTYPSFEDPF